MPKELIPAGWVQKPCLFLLPLRSSNAEMCAECDGEFSWLGKNSKRYCVFCGYFFHRNGCTQKVQVEGEFFRQRICLSCYTYRTIAEKLKAGEEFECVGSHGRGSGRCSSVTISLCEDTAELVLHWKAIGVKETADLAEVEIRKGFSHVHQDTTGGNYEPLLSFSLFLKGGMGEQSAYHLRANCALTCQLWVEGLKAANYVYHKMLEQEQALQFYSDKDVRVSSQNRWHHRRLYLPTPDLLPSPLSTPSQSGPGSACGDLQSPGLVEDEEEWEEIASPPYTPNRLLSSAIFPNRTSVSSLYGNGSSYQLELSLSLCSSTMPQQRQPLTVHSLNFTASSRHHNTHGPTSRPHTAPSSGRKQASACSLPPTPRLPATASQRNECSLPPTPGLVSSTQAQGQTATPFSLTCPCHFRTVPPRQQSLNLSKTSSSSTLDKCCEECKVSCRLTLDI